MAGGAETHAWAAGAITPMYHIDPSDGMTFWHVNEYLPLRGPGFNGQQESVSSTSKAEAQVPRQRQRHPTGTPVSPTLTATATATPTDPRFASADGNGNGYGYRRAQVYSDTAAAPHAAASALRAALTVVFFGDSRSLASPRNVYFP